MIGYMLDTNVFNDLVDGRISFEIFQRKKLIATHVQYNELKATRDEERRKQLISIFNETAPTMLPTNTSVWDDTPWNQGCWKAEDAVYQEMFVALQGLDKSTGKQRDSMNQSRDVRIAETAIKNDLALVTDDQNLRDITEKFGGTAISLSQFEELLIS